MPRQELRRHFIFYHTLGPMVAGGLALMVILLIVSMLTTGAFAARARGLGIIVFCVLTLVGLLRSLIVIWKTRNLEQ